MSLAPTKRSSEHFVGMKTQRLGQRRKTPSPLCDTRVRTRPSAGQRRFPCPTCSAKLRTKRTVMMHMRIHTETAGQPSHESDVGKELFLTPLIEEGKIARAKNLSRVGVLPGSNVESYSGFLTVDKETNSNLFFWFVPALKNPDTAPILLWLQGGPGGSSLLGLFVEYGPYIVNSDLKLELRNTTWTKEFSVIYIDNPVGTGFSFTDEDDGYSTQMLDIGKNLFNALQQFFTLFHEYSLNDFYVTGESMAGKFVPAAAHIIHQNRNIAKMKLTGILIGDGLCDPETMMDYGDFYQAVGLIGDQQAHHFRAEERKIRAALARNDTLEAYFLWAKLIDIYLSDREEEPITYFNNATGFDYKFNLLQSEIPSFGPFKKFVTLPPVRHAIHVGNRSYGGGVAVLRHLWGAMMTSSKQWIAELIEHYKVLIYNGQLDLLVPYPLTKKFVDSIEWSGRRDLLKVGRVIWRDSAGSPLGYVRQVKNFTEVLVRNAGHFLAFDQPAVASDLVRRYIKGEAFD